MADEGLAEDAEGRLMDKDGVEHIPSDVRRNPWFAGPVAGLAWYLLWLGALIASRRERRLGFLLGSGLRQCDRLGGADVRLGGGRLKSYKPGPLRTSVFV